jgi:hypothetical protein
MASTYLKNPIVKGNLAWVKSIDGDMESRDFETKKKAEIRRGQAYNCALDVAIALGKANDTKFFFKEYLRQLQQIIFIQKSKVEDIVIALDNPEFIHLLNNVDEHLNYLKETT